MALRFNNLMAERGADAAGDNKRLKEEKDRQQTLLNKTFSQFCSKADKLASWVDAARDYEYYSMELDTWYSEGISNGALYSFGCGDCGQLGHGASDPPIEDEETSVAKPKKVKAFENAKDVRILEASGLANGLVDSKGLWTWGCADNGALGRDGDENIPTLVRFPGRVIVTSLSLGESHGACAALSGLVYLWGSYRDKEGKLFFPTSEVLGRSTDKLSPSGTIQNSPAEISSLQNIIRVASGANHTVFLNGTGEVYSLGLGEQDQLGRPVNKQLKDADQSNPNAEPKYNLTVIHGEHLKPRKIELEGDAKSIGCGAYHTLVVLAVRFKVYGCGLNQYQQVAPKSEASLHMTHLSHLDGKYITFLQGGEHFSLAMSINGELYAWGRSDQCQLGRPSSGSAGSFDGIPTKVENLPLISQVFAGSSHVLAKTRDGQVFSWGFGEMLQLGHGEGEGDELRPRKIDFFKSDTVRKVSAGAQHSCVLIG